MTPTVMGQKIEEILQICKKLIRHSKHNPSNEETPDQNDQPDRDGGADLQAIVRDSPNKGEQRNPQQKKWFWDSWSVQDRIQISLAIFTALAVASGVWSNIQTRSLVKTAQDTYATANRPYIGPNGGTISTLVNQSDNKPYGVQIKSDVKNYGTAPGEDFEFTWEVRINGVAISADPKRGSPYTLFPGETASLTGMIEGSPVFDDIDAGRSILQINLHIKYKGNNKSYEYCERQQYDFRYHDMLTMGPVCDDPWAKGPHPPPAAIQNLRP
jgi:hypothetical protein